MANSPKHGRPDDGEDEHLLRAILGVLRETELHNRNRHLEVLNALRQRKKRVSFDFSVGMPKLKEKQSMPLELKITNEQQINVTLNPRTDTGKPAKLDGSPAWTVISGNSQVVVAADGLSADLVSSDEPGDTIVSVKADADLGEGVEELADTITLSVIGATAKNLGLTAGPATPKPTV